MEYAIGIIVVFGVVVFGLFIYTIGYHNGYACGMSHDISKSEVW